MLKIKLASIMVDDQAKAEAFYTQVLGFQKKQDIDLGEARWLTVVSAAEPDGTELLLEPMTGLAQAADFQRAVYDAGMPAMSFAVDDIKAEYARLQTHGVRFRGELTVPESGPAMVTLEDTCGNLVALFQV